MKNVAPNPSRLRRGRATVKCDFDESSKVNTISLSGIGSSAPRATLRNSPFVGAGSPQRPQAEDAVLRIFGRRLEEPDASRFGSLRNAFLLCRLAPMPQRPQGQIGRREIARLGRGAAAGRPPVVQILVACQKVLDHCLA